MFWMIAVISTPLAAALVAMDRGHTGPPAPTSASLAGRAAVALAWLGIAVVATTAMLGLALHGALRGWLLLAHVSAAPIMLLGLAAMAVCPLPTSRYAGVALLVGALSAGTALAAMTPWFGYDSMVRLIEIHRYCGGLMPAVWLLLSVDAAALLRRPKGSMT